MIIHASTSGMSLSFLSAHSFNKHLLGSYYSPGTVIVELQS